MTKRKAPDPHSLGIENAVRAMDPDHVQCRDYGHSWRPHNAAWLERDRCYRVELRCTRCATIRTRLLSSRGAQLESHYDYAEGYQIHGLGRLTGTDRDLIRLRSVTSLLDRSESSA